MADEQKPTPEAGAKGMTPLIRKIVLLGMFILIPAILALATFTFVLRPMLAAPAEAEPEEPITDIIPAGAMAVDFDEAQASVRTENPDEAAPILIYKISMAVSNANTAALIESRKAWFNSMLGKLHRNRTRAELNDPYVEDTILKQAKQEANLLLKKLDPEGKHEVLEVMHIKYAMFDL